MSSRKSWSELKSAMSDIPGVLPSNMPVEKSLLDILNESNGRTKIPSKSSSPESDAREKYSKTKKIYEEMMGLTPIKESVKAAEPNQNNTPVINIDKIMSGLKVIKELINESDISSTTAEKILSNIDIIVKNCK